MVQFNFNAQNYAPNVGEGGTVPTGIYDVQIVASEVKATKRGDGHMLVLTFSIIAGPLVGKRIVGRYNIHNPNPTAVEIAMGELSALSHVIGVLAWGDTNQLHGRPLKLKIEEIQRQDDPTKMGNEIKAYFDAQGLPASPTGGQAMAPAAPPAPAGAPAQPAAAYAPPPTAPAPVADPAPAAVAAQVAAPAVAPPVQQVAPPAPAHTEAGSAPPWQTGAPAPAPSAGVPGAAPPWATA